MKNAATPPLEWIQEKALTYISEKLAEDENILWYGVPDVETQVTESRRYRRQGFIYFHVFLVLPLVVALLVYGQPVPLDISVILNAFYLVFGALIYLVTVSRPTELFVVTSKRLFLNSPGSEPKALSELSYDSLREITVEDVKESGTDTTRVVGTLTFSRYKDTMKFYRVEDPQAVKEIIEAAKTAWLTRPVPPVPLKYGVPIVSLALVLPIAL